MSSSNKFNKTLLAGEKICYINLNLENISDNKHGKKYACSFFMKNIEDYFDLHIQCGTLLLTDILENFRDTCVTS